MTYDPLVSKIDELIKYHQYMADDARNRNAINEAVLCANVMVDLQQFKRFILEDRHRMLKKLQEAYDVEFSPPGIWAYETAIAIVKGEG